MNKVKLINLRKREGESARERIEFERHQSDPFQSKFGLSRATDRIEIGKKYGKTIYRDCIAYAQLVWVSGEIWNKKKEKNCFSIACIHIRNHYNNQKSTQQQSNREESKNDIRQ